MSIIRKVYVENNGGFSLGMDNLTPVTFVFSNRISKNAYITFSLDPVAENQHVQTWIRSLPDKQIIMSRNELANKLLELWRN